jgi:hypothetical protein
MEKARASGALQIGDAVLVRGQVGELTGIHEGGGCTVTFEAEGVEGSKTYTSMYGRSKGSARLQRPPPSLAPTPRAARSDKLSMQAVKLIQAFWRSRCSISPHQRDARKRRTAADPAYALALVTPEISRMMFVIVSSSLSCDCTGDGERRFSPSMIWRCRSHLGLRNLPVNSG